MVRDTEKEGNVHEIVVTQYAFKLSTEEKDSNI